MESGAEATAPPPDLFPEVATVASDASRRGVKYFAPNLGKRRYGLKVRYLVRTAHAHIVPVWKSSLALCSPMDSGHDVYFNHDAGGYAVHTTREELEIHRRGGRFEIYAKIVLPSHKQVKP